VNTGAAATAYDRLLAAVDTHGSRVRVNGTKAATAQCPGHDDRNPSLSLRWIDGSVLLKCFAGCHVEDVLAALNLGLADLYDGEKPAGYTFTPRTTFEPPNPLGDVDHFCDRILQQERLEADPAYQARRRATGEWVKTGVWTYEIAGDPINDTPPAGLEEAYDAIEARLGRERRAAA
jgi:hypothetical protein